MGKKRVIVVGAGPGGLTAAMLLASHGYEVEVFERLPEVGGRNSRIQTEGYTFDVGPTFLMMRDILAEMFEFSGRDIADYLDIREIEPLYRLRFGDGTEFLPTRDRREMEAQIERLFPGNSKGYRKYLNYEARKYERLLPCLQVPYSSPLDFLKTRFIKAAPYLDAHKSLYAHLGRYFDTEELKLSFTFQAKYLGMSPWRCPATFSIISFLEHGGGVHHPIGGLNAISHAMAKVVEEEGGRVHCSTPVQQVMVRGRRAVGVQLDDGSEVRADHVVLNADFGYAMNHLIPRGVLKRWTPRKLKKKGFSCSGFLMYLGVDGRYDDLPHHSILFASDYERNVREIADDLVLSEDPSFYVQNASVTDPTLAPEGKSTIYILVPIANNRSGIDWPSVTPRFRDKILDLAEKRGGFEGLRDRIEVERIVTPHDFEHKYNVYEGAVFNLAHTVDQMLYFRPHNAFEEIDDLYLVGGGTHPGSGLPTIYESGRISAGLIMKRDAWWS